MQSFLSSFTTDKTDDNDFEEGFSHSGNINANSQDYRNKINKWYNRAYEKIKWKEQEKLLLEIKLKLIQKELEKYN